MNKNAFTQRWVAGFAVFLLILSNLAFIPQVSHAATLEQAVTIKAIDENGEVVLPLTAVDFDEGETAFDLLIEAGEKHDLEVSYDVYDFGNMITGIGNYTPTGSAYWSFNSNGIAAEVGSSAYPAKNGEHYLFAITEWPNPSVTAKVTAVGKDGLEVIPETPVTLMQGASAYDALVQAAAEHQQSIHSSVDSDYFTFIKNIGSTAVGPNDYWSIAVNDDDLTASATAYTLAENDHVQLTLETYVPPTEPGTEEPDEPVEPTEPTEPAQPQEPTDSNEPINKNVETSVDDILTYLDANNISLVYGNEWWIWGVANTNREIPASYIPSVKEKVKESEGNYQIFDLEKLIIGLSAAGEDATSVEGYNLVDTLVKHRNLANPSINMSIYALLAVDSGQYQTPEGFREELVNRILASELAQGGWSFFGSNPSPDITGMALTALAPYRDQEHVQAAIDRAVTYLSEAQGETGGFDIAMNGGDASESLSATIVGLASVGVNPTGEAFTKAGGNLVQHLLKFKQEDGGFSHLQSGASSGMATQQALLALTAYQSLVNGGGLVYQFDLIETDNPELPETPTETEQPEQPENPDQPEQSEEPKQPEQPEQPVNPEQPQLDEQQPIETDQPDSSEGNGQSITATDVEAAAPSKTGNVNGSELPNTATNQANKMVVGLGFVLVGSILFYIRRKRAA